MSHYRQECEHGRLIMQCRCRSSTDKEIRVLKPCPFDCPPKESLKSDHLDQARCKNPQCREVLDMGSRVWMVETGFCCSGQCAHIVSELKLRPGDQQLPVVNDEPDVQSQVIADIEERRQVGISRYGTALQPFNGRDALRDAYEEAIDLAMYLKQAILERDQR